MFHTPRSAVPVKSLSSAIRFSSKYERLSLGHRACLIVVSLLVFSLPFCLRSHILHQSWSPHNMIIQFFFLFMMILMIFLLHQPLTPPHLSCCTSNLLFPFFSSPTFQKLYKLLVSPFRRVHDDSPPYNATLQTADFIILFILGPILIQALGIARLSFLCEFLLCHTAQDLISVLLLPFSVIRLPIGI